jgi:hypothetical protein
VAPVGTPRSTRKASTARPVSLQIEAPSKWDALALARALSRYKWHLFQPSHERWHVCLQVEAAEDELPEELLRSIRSWLSERRLAGTLVHAPKGDHAIESSAAPVR